MEKVVVVVAIGRNEEDTVRESESVIEIEIFRVLFLIATFEFGLRHWNCD